MSAKKHTFTLGIEEEFAIIDPDTGELRSHIQEILEGGKIVLKEQIKPEMHQSVVELGTEICDSIEHARTHVIDLRSKLAKLAGKAGLKIASVGTHPFSHWRDQHITQGARYNQTIQDMQLLARANVTFGLHVHMGVHDREMAINGMNQARYWLPHVYALSVNSPFRVGEDTGLKGYRLKVFERFPRTIIPDSFESLSEYEDYCKLLVKTGCIDNAKKIWWDIRLHPFFDTLEVRVCDAQTRVDDTLAIAALIQAVIAKLFKLLWRNTTFRIYRRRLLDENRWRAARYGIDGKLIDFGKETEVEERSLLNELLEFVASEVDEFGTHREMTHIERIMREGTGADRQLAAYERTHDMKAVVDDIVAETYEGLNAPGKAAIAS